MNSDYKPSAHQVGEQPPDFDRYAGVAMLSVVLVVIALVVVFKSPEPVSCDRPAQVHQK